MAQSNAASESDGYPVKIFVYDLSQGMASMYSQQLLGKQVDGIWHTSVIVYEKEYFYGGGIQSDNPGRTPYGNPVQRIDMGVTNKTQSQFHDFLEQVAPRFSPSKYDLFKHNCNNFADEAVKFLNSKPIPAFITGLPEEFLNSAVGQMLKPMIDNMTASASAQYGDWAGAGIASRPHLPPLNPKYNAIVQRKPKEDAIASKVKATEPKATVPCAGSLKLALDKQRSDHAHLSMQLKVIPHELNAKLTYDKQNAALYIGMIEKNDDNGEMLHDAHKQALIEIKQYLVSDDKSSNPLSDSAFEMFDELLIMTEAKHLFPLVSVLRLLLVEASISKRYSADFMIINQILYKIGIPFDDNDVPLDTDELKTEPDQDMEMNLMDMHLLQFTVISAVSHLFTGQQTTGHVSPEMLNLAFNALRVSNSANVRLAAARLLFNMVCTLKLKLIATNKDEDIGTSDLATLKRIIVGISNYLTSTMHAKAHVPTVYRLLACIAVTLYAHKLQEKVISELKMDKQAIQQLLTFTQQKSITDNSFIRDMKQDIMAVA